MKKVNCVFCEKKQDKSKEHIWPRWLQKEIIGDTKSNYRGDHLSLSTVSTVSTRVQGGESFVFGKICNVCNNGWMSELEVSFKEILKLIRSNTLKINELSIEERKIIGLWAWKTGMMINLGTNYRRIIPPKHFKYLYENRITPDDLYIDLAVVNSPKKLAWEQANIMFFGFESSSEGINVNELIENSYVVSMLIGQLGIKVSYCDEIIELGGQMELAEPKKMIRILPEVQANEYEDGSSYDDISSFHLETTVIIP